MRDWIDDAARRAWRDDHVQAFLDAYRIARSALTPATLQCLDSWARQAQLVEFQPSSDFGKVILDLCRAVESELAAGIGTVPGLECLDRADTLGQKAHALKQVVWSPPLKQQLESRGLKPGAVKSLPEKLLQLAATRSTTDAAHGGAQIAKATELDAKKARDLAGRILRDVLATKAGSC
jgi:hypothetical protein